jgi:hypothetical protein
MLASPLKGEGQMVSQPFEVVTCPLDRSIDHIGIQAALLAGGGGGDHHLFFWAQSEKNHVLVSHGKHDASTSPSSRQ